MTQNNWDYSAITPEINNLTKKMTDNSIIDPSLYSKYNVKRGLRDLDGKGPYGTYRYFDNHSE